MDLSIVAAAISASLIVLGTAFGISKVASSAVESIARQPEAGGDIRLTMLIAIAMIEGVALFSVVICFMIASK